MSDNKPDGENGRSRGQYQWTGFAFSRSSNISSQPQNNSSSSFSHNPLRRGNLGAMTPTPKSQFTGASRLDPRTARFESSNRYQDPIVRPESSISNATFATQLPRGTYLSLQSANLGPAVGRPPYLGQQQSAWAPSANNGYSTFMGAMGTGFADLSLGSATSFHQRAAAIERIDSANGSGSNANDFLNVGCPTPYALAASIRKGDAEDPYDRSLKRLDMPSKNPAPALGPARFKDTKMFSTAPDSPDVETASKYAPPRLQDPPLPPDWLNLALEGLCIPTLDEAYDALPFTELCRKVSPGSGGVIRIKDIPYQTTRQEMTAFVGRNAQILRQPKGSPYHAVHIMMERETGKTMDCFIELASPSEAAWVVRQFASRVASKRPPKVGDRAVEVLYSSQDELLLELFPRAKHVRWSGGQPVVDTTPRKYYRDQNAAGFQGFIHSEELVMLEKHASLSDRSPFASKSPCRVYESMITTLYKYPWYAIEHIKIKERRAIFDCFMSLLRTLVEQLRRGTYRQEPLNPSPGLLQELTVAALTCPGFSEKQKACIFARLHQNGYSSMLDGRRINVNFGGGHECSAVFPFAALSFEPGTNNDLIKHYGKLFQEATATPQYMSLADRKAATATSNGVNAPMGQFKIDYGSDPGELSLSDVAKIEYNKIEQLLRIVCNQAPISTSASFSRANGVNRVLHGSSSGSSSSSYAACSLF